MKLKPILAPAALAVAAILVVMLAMRVRRLERENEELFRRVTRPYAGMYVPAFTAPGTGGRAVQVGSPARGRQVLFVFNSTCPYCRASIPAWTRVAASAEAANGPGAAVGVSLDPPDSAAAYATRHGLRYPVAAFPDRRMAALYRTRTVPVTLVVDSTGRVLLARIGELTEGPAMDSVRAAAGLAAR
ncbi:MAG TPA: TlpA disulfide reductase family protein [Longimicrobium sp.]|nr:TlpA disulfide reductase family protein [Longimicrobium sp.]